MRWIRLLIAGIGAGCGPARSAPPAPASPTAPLAVVVDAAMAIDAAPTPLVIEGARAITCDRVAAIPKSERLARAASQDRLVDLARDGGLHLELVPADGGEVRRVDLPADVGLGDDVAGLRLDGDLVEVVGLGFDGQGGLVRWSESGGWAEPRLLPATANAGAELHALRDGWVALPEPLGAGGDAWWLDAGGTISVPDTIARGSDAPTVARVVPVAGAAVIVIGDGDRTRAFRFSRSGFRELGAPLPWQGAPLSTAVQVAAGPVEAAVLWRTAPEGELDLVAIDARGGIRRLVVPIGEPTHLRWSGDALVAWGPGIDGWIYRPGDREVTEVHGPSGAPDIWGISTIAEVGGLPCALGGGTTGGRRVAGAACLDLARGAIELVRADPPTSTEAVCLDVECLEVQRWSPGCDVVAEGERALLVCADDHGDESLYSCGFGESS